MVRMLTATPQTLMAQLWEKGIDFTKITAYELFYTFIVSMYPQDATSIIFGDLDFTKFVLYKRKTDDEVVLAQYVDGKDIVIDEGIYNAIANYLRTAHDIEKDERIPANESTKMILIEDAISDMELMKRKPYHSQLKNLVSAMTNSAGFKYSHSQVWDMKINAFMDSVKRISKIKNADLLLQSGYSGYGISLKNIDKKQLNWLGELD